MKGSFPTINTHPRSPMTKEAEKTTRRRDSLTPQDIFKMEVGKQATKHSEHFEKHSSLVNNRTRTVAELQWSDVEVGKLLGKGAFSHVYEVKLSAKAHKRHKLAEILNHSNSNSNTNSNNHSDDYEDADCFDDMWDMISTHGISLSAPFNETEDSEPQDIQFALKHLDPQEDNENFAYSAIDIVLEAKILSCLDHDNIIKLHGVTAGSLVKSFSKKGYFLLLDRLETTLDKEIIKWARQEVELDYSKAKRVSKLEERLKIVGMGVARGMKYLHDNQIVFRDLKPANIGFTRQHNAQHRTVKIFDFGLAREVDPDPDKRMTGYTGSARYMAPEVARSERYGLSADVYSFGILLWELCTLSKPFKNIHTKEDFVATVVCADLRPKLQSVNGSSQLKKLMQKCWSATASKRPTFSEIRRRLHMEVNANDPSSGSAGSGKKKARRGFLQRQGRRESSILDRFVLWN